MKAKTRIKQYYDERKNFEKGPFIVEIKSKRDNKYHPLWNGSVLHTFDTYEQAEVYRDSVSPEIDALVENEPVKRT
jgi:hypothetical protein